MTNKTSDSLNSLPSPENGATGSPWQPSWWRWFHDRALSQISLQALSSSLGALAKLILSALSGTVEIERQAALDEQRHAQKMSELKAYNEELRIKNKRLAELQSRLNEILHS